MFIVYFTLNDIFINAMRSNDSLTAFYTRSCGHVHEKGAGSAVRRNVGQLKRSPTFSTVPVFWHPGCVEIPSSKLPRLSYTFQPTFNQLITPIYMAVIIGLLTSLLNYSRSRQLISIGLIGTQRTLPPLIIPMVLSTLLHQMHKIRLMLQQTMK